MLKKSITETEEAKAIQVAFAEIGARVILKYCKRCGEALTEDSNHCGNLRECSDAHHSLTLLFILKNTLVSKHLIVCRDRKNIVIIYCPKCKSQKLQTVVESNTEGKGGGYGAGKGCLGGGYYLGR